MSYNVKNFNGRLCLRFSSVLAAITENEYRQIGVLLVDERYTTREAKIRMKSEGVRGSLDAYSAACLIERYVEDEGEGALEARACEYPIPPALEFFDYSEVSEYIRKQYSDPITEEFLNRKRIQRMKDGRTRP
jgi:hypothetical protein